MASEMVEKVARAINDEEGMYAMPQEWHYAQARAAILAMREPTKEMLAGINNCDKPHCSIVEWYGIMIDAALAV